MPPKDRPAGAAHIGDWQPISTTVADHVLSRAASLAKARHGNIEAFVSEAQKMNGVGKHEVKVLAVSCYMHFAGSMLDTDCPVGPGAEDENNWIVSGEEGTAMQKLRCLRRHMFVSG